MKFYQRICIVVACSSLFLVKIHCQLADFETYGIFKFENTTSLDSSPCLCERNSNERGFEWNEWSKCRSHTGQFRCHQAIQFRLRSCSNKTDRNECKQRQWKYCYDAKGCAGEWQQWTSQIPGGECSRSCGGGVRMKVRACTWNNEIGMFCKGRYRSPYNSKVETCNSQSCPTWTQWTEVENNCTGNMDYASEMVILKRECQGGMCGTDHNITNEISVRNCSWIRRRTPGNLNSDNRFSLNILSLILLGIIAFMVVTSTIFGIYCFSKQRRPSQNRMKKGKRSKEWLDRFYDNNSSKKQVIYRDPSPKKLRPNKKFHANYEEISLSPSINSSTQGYANTGISNLSRRTLERNSTLRSETYTYMSGSSTLGSNGRTLPRANFGRSEISSNSLNFKRDRFGDERPPIPPPLPPPLIDFEKEIYKDSVEARRGASLPRHLSRRDQNDGTGRRTQSRERRVKRTRKSGYEKPHKFTGTATKIPTKHQDLPTNLDTSNATDIHKNGYLPKGKHLYAEIREHG